MLEPQLLSARNSYPEQKKSETAMKWSIRNVEIPGRVVLGPMAGVTDLPFRLLCREQGAALTVTEMVSAKALTYHNSRTQDLMRTVAAEEPLSIQIFGHEPGVMGEAAALLEEMAGPAEVCSGTEHRTGSFGAKEPGEELTFSEMENSADAEGGQKLRFDILDINMGCPMPKIANNQEGSALMKDPALIERIVAACVQNTSRPVTVKLRAGFDASHLNAAECARAAEAGGASMVAVHGRTRTQMYSGLADWSVIREVVQAVRIPVVGNGDVTDGPSARRMLEETGCTAVMIGRAARGNPWIFREVNRYLETGQGMERPSRQEVIRTLLRHADLERQVKGERIGMQEMRSHAGWYLQGFPGASKLRSQINAVKTFDELEGLLRREFPYA